MIKRTIQCDKCTISFLGDDVENTQEFLSLEFDGGYGAPFGDGTEATLDLCPNCQIELFGEYIVYPNGQ